MFICHPRHSYEAREQHAVLRRNGAENTVKWWEQYFNSDKCHLKGGTVFKAPPCARLYHVYAITRSDEIVRCWYPL